MPRDVLKRFGTNVRKFRKLAGYSQESFANQVGIDRSYMGHIERGQKNITIIKVDLIAKELGVRIGQLLDE